MGADFYPRLTAVAKDNAECNRLVNEQAHVSLLLAGPGVIATISLAPLVIALFYSTKFYAAVDVLRWLCLGMALRILSWPMGFIILAKGAQRFFFWSEAAWTVVYLALAWVCVDSFGLNGAGIAFFGSYIFHVLMVVLIVRRLSGFRWSVETKKASFFFIALLGLVFWATHTLPPVLGVITGTLVAALSGVYSVRVLIKLVSHDRIPRRILTLLAWFHLADPGPASA
jgi:PST family polysaccharide transporter